MAAKFFVFIAFLALTTAAMVRRDAPADGNNALKADYDAFLEQLSAFSNTLQKTITDATGKAKETLEATKQNIDQSVVDLRKAHPELEQQAGQLSDQVRLTVETGVQNIQKFTKDVQTKAEVEYQKLAPAFKEAADNVAKSAADLQKKFQEATTKQ